VQIRSLTGMEALDDYAAIHSAVHPEDPTSADDLRGWVASRTDSGFFLAGEGDPVGVAWVALDGTRPLPEARILVLDGWRGSGIGSALFAALSSWAAERSYSEVEARVRETHPDGIAFAKRRGFVEIGREQGLELDLTGIEPPVAEPPAGIEIVTWAERPDAIEGLYAVYREAIPDVPGEEESEIEPFDVWLKTHMQGPGDHPRATFVALDGDEVVGFAKFALTDSQPTTAFHDLTAVRRAARGRGIAGALKATQVRWAKENGYERLLTQNEDRNAPIRRLNERFGYRAAPGRVLLRGPIAAA
jgi:GNAT superfamily N-acetyltransferase